jgi:hypothetical protein
MFYNKLIIIDNLIAELDSLDLSDEERIHLATLVDTSLHHAIMDEILSNLSPEDKKVFLSEMSKNPQDEVLLEFLNEKIDNIEDKIKTVSDQLVKEMHKDVKEAKRVKDY